MFYLYNNLERYIDITWFKVLPSSIYVTALVVTILQLGSIYVTTLV